MKTKTNSLFDDLNIDLDNLCGIDEAGRGPIAGSLVMAGAILTKKVDGLDDSKKLTEKKREKLYEIVKNSSKYFIYEVNAAKIDEIGLSKSIKECLEAIKQRAEKSGEENHFGKDSNFLFDGNSSFGVEGIPTLVKADAKVQAVSAASILAKVYRDRQMIEYAKKYPEYGFEKHKGYGTKAHLEAIEKYGYCKIHRRSFKIKLKNRENNLF